MKEVVQYFVLIYIFIILLGALVLTGVIMTKSLVDTTFSPTVSSQP